MTALRPPRSAVGAAPRRPCRAGTVGAAIAAAKPINPETHRFRCPVAAALLLVGATAAQAQAPWSARAISSICTFDGDCDHDFRTSDTTAQSSIGRLYQYVDSSGGGGYNYSAYGANSVGKKIVSLFADAGGHSTAHVTGGVGCSGSANQLLEASSDYDSLVQRTPHWLGA